MRSLDRIDRQILGELQKDARLSNKELSAQVGLAPSTTLARVQRLVRERVLTGFHASVDPDALGLLIQAIVFVQLESHGGSAIADFQQHLLTCPEVLQLYHVGGAQDLLVHVAVRDTEHLRRVVMDVISARPEVRHIETNILFEHHRAPLPISDGPSAMSR